MFNLFEYLETITPAFPEIGATYKASGLSRLEELLTNLRSNPKCCVVARDSGDGFLNLRGKRLDTAYHLFYVFVKAKLQDHDNILQAKREAMATGVSLIEKFKEDSEDFGDPTYGFDDSRVDYLELGPVATDYYGYSFSFLMEHSI